MSAETFGFLPSAIVLGDDVVVDGLPKGTTKVQARTAFGRTFAGTIAVGAARLSNLPIGTHAIEAVSVDGEVLGDDFVSVRSNPGDDPVVDQVRRARCSHLLREVAAPVPSTLRRRGPRAIGGAVRLPQDGEVDRR